jgi:hypothetical protein
MIIGKKLKNWHECLELLVYLVDSWIGEIGVYFKRADIKINGIHVHLWHSLPSHSFIQLLFIILLNSIVVLSLFHIHIFLTVVHSTNNTNSASQASNQHPWFTTFFQSFLNCLGSILLTKNAKKFSVFCTDF